MLTVLTGRAATILICVGLALVVALILRKLRRDKRAGKGCSGCSGCAGCPRAGGCAERDEQNK